MTTTNYQGLKRLLVNYLRDTGGWVHSGKLESMEWRNPKNGRKYKPSTMSRRLRELAEDGVLEVGGEKSVEYRYKGARKAEYWVTRPDGTRMQVV